MQESCGDKLRSIVSLPAWWPSEPASNSQILDVRKIGWIFGRGKDRLRISLITTNWQFKCLSSSWGKDVSLAIARLSEDEIRMLKASTFQIAVDKGAIAALRFGRKIPRWMSIPRPIPIEPECQSDMEDLYGAWLPELTACEYIFLCDCRQLESEGRALTEDQIKRIASIRRQSMRRNLFSPPVYI